MFLWESVLSLSLFCASKGGRTEGRKVGRKEVRKEGREGGT
jgi:hypothetical protein